MQEPVKVTSIMTADVITVTTETPIPEIARIMLEHGVSGVPVVEDGRLVGIVTESDVVSREIAPDAPAYATFLDAIFVFPWDRSDEELKRAMATTAAGIMSSPVRTITSNSSIQDLADVMFKLHVNPVPVVDDAGSIVGIVSRSDVLRLIAEAG